MFGEGVVTILFTNREIYEHYHTGVGGEGEGVLEVCNESYVGPILGGGPPGGVGIRDYLTSTVLLLQSQRRGTVGPNTLANIGYVSLVPYQPRVRLGLVQDHQR